MTAEILSCESEYIKPPQGHVNTILDFFFRDLYKSNVRKLLSELVMTLFLQSQLCLLGLLCLVSVDICEQTPLCCIIKGLVVDHVYTSQARFIEPT